MYFRSGMWFHSLCGKAALWVVLVGIALGLGGSGAAFGAQNAESTPVLEASKGVLRVIAALPLPDGGDGIHAAAIIKLLLPSTEVEVGPLRQTLAKVREKGWANHVLRTKNGRAISLTFFAFQGNIYWHISFGSTYLVSRQGHWVTNHHVVEEENLKYFLLIALLPRPNFLPVKVLWKDEKKDLAVLQSEPPTNITPLVFADVQDIIPTLPVSSIGFPGASDELGGGPGYNDPDAYLSPKINSGTLSHSFNIANHNTKMWQHHAAITHGNSGGPLVNECGQVVGTNSMGHAEWQAANGAIDLSELLPVLDDSLHVSYTKASGRCERPAVRIPKWMYGALAGVAALVAGIIGFLFYLHGQKKAPVPPVPPVPTPDKEINWIRGDDGREYVFDTIYGVVFRGEEPPGFLPQPDPPSPPKPNEGGFRLSSTRLGDITLQAGQELIIGSSGNRAHVVIPERIISMAHVRLSHRGGQLVVEDLRSTNGTFINGRRLTAPEVMRPGDVLSLTAKPGLAEYRFETGAGSARPGFRAVLTPQFPGALAVTVGEGHIVTIGRTPNNTVTVPDSVVSERHCSLRANADGSFELRDEGSLNGTFVPGRSGPIKTASLKIGQSFYVVKPAYAFKITGA